MKTVKEQWKEFIAAVRDRTTAANEMEVRKYLTAKVRLIQSASITMGDSAFLLVLGEAEKGRTVEDLIKMGIDISQEVEG